MTLDELEVRYQDVIDAVYNRFQTLLLVKQQLQARLGESTEVPITEVTTFLSLLETSIQEINRTLQQFSRDFEEYLNQQS
ncbi:MAG: hypothetical protein VKK04_11480 [Synechococcales bacterium]|nr:hypothetical protein [Synechococcales bacterium]